MSDVYKNVYNPDVLSCLANLSNDEVFTPPEIANAMLDLLPKDIWKNSNATFLDPSCKSGVFLREIAKRLITGLEDEIPNLQERIDHIFHKQLFGISITELTSLLSRRSVYCSKFANGKYSISKFDNPEGNIHFNQIKHTWKNNQCIYCGASKDEYDRNEMLESHAYEFIHEYNIKDISKMKFDVIISNPPYQLSDGGAQASAIPIYNKFIEKAKKLKPRFLTMIVPARWMTGGRGLDKFRTSMINDKHISVLHDYENSKECFSGVEIKGGICYFLWERDKEGKCNIYRHNGKEIAHSYRYLVEPNENIYIRYEKLITIKNKVWNIEKKSFEDIVSSQKPYGLRGDFFKSPEKYNLPKISTTKIENGYSIIGLSSQKRCYRYVPNDYPFPKKGLLDSYKIFVPRNWGMGELGEVPAKPIFANPGEACTETFIEIGPFKDENERYNAYTYFCTKFFRTLVFVRKQDQSSAKAVYGYVPLLDFSKPWTDEELYKRYNLNEEEINYIETVIKPMEMEEK